ncbi:hypothetical protein AAVH_27683 [Aphelenchoides avenae]|nr:hypothetical protein AAVH_27683 [Aphelenchus avenae]
MLLPVELLLDVLRFADYSTLISAKFVDARFLDVVAKFAAEPHAVTVFTFSSFFSYITYTDATIGSRRKSVRYEPGDQVSLAAASRELAGVIGPHAVSKLIFLQKHLDCAWCWRHLQSYSSIEVRRRRGALQRVWLYRWE